MGHKPGDLPFIESGPEVIAEVVQRGGVIQNAETIGAIVPNEAGDLILLQVGMEVTQPGSKAGLAGECGVSTSGMNPALAG